MNVFTTCPSCGATEVKTWHFINRNGKKMRVCETCGPDVDPPELNTDFSEKAKKKVEEDRKRKNAEILRQLKNGSLPHAPGSR